MLGYLQMVQQEQLKDVQRQAEKRRLMQRGQSQPNRPKLLKRLLPHLQ